MATPLADSRFETTNFVYAKGQLSEKSLVPCTQHTHLCGGSFLGSHIRSLFSQVKRCFVLHPGSCPGASQASWPSACIFWSCQFHNHSFRARETHDFKTKHSPMSVSCTRNAHFQNQASSRVRETPLFVSKKPSHARQTPTLGSGSRRRGCRWLGQRLQMHSISSRSVHAKRQLFNNCTLQRASRAREMRISQI